MSVGGFGEKSAAVYEASVGERSHSMCCFAMLGATVRSKAPLSPRTAKLFTHRHPLKNPPVRPGKPLSFGMLVVTSGFVPYGSPEQWCCLTWQFGDFWRLEAYYSKRAHSDDYAGTTNVLTRPALVYA